MSSSAPTVVAALALVAGGCGFRPAGGGDGATDGGATDAGPDAAVDSGPASPLCSDDPSLLLCLGFADGRASNGVPGAEADLVRDLGAVAGVVGEAGGFKATTALHFPEDVLLDVDELTIDAFVWLDEPPPTGGSRRVGILDNDGQYSLFVRQHFPEGASSERPYAYCNANATVFAPMPTETGRWYHLACVHDGASLTLYVDGVPAPSVASGRLATGATNGTTLGQNCDNNPSTVSDPLIGRLDEVRLWDRPLTASEIAAAAARR